MGWEGVLLILLGSRIDFFENHDTFVMLYWKGSQFSNSNLDVVVLGDRRYRKGMTTD